MSKERKSISVNIVVLFIANEFSVKLPIQSFDV